MRVLLVDSSTSRRSMLAHFFYRQGWVAVLASNFQAGCDILDREEINLIIRKADIEWSSLDPARFVDYILIRFALDSREYDDS